MSTGSARHCGTKDLSNVTRTLQYLRWILPVLAMALIVPISLAFQSRPLTLTGPKAQPVTPQVSAETLALERRFKTDVRPLITQHCFHCHGNGKHKGDLDLDRFTSLSSIQAERVVWQNISDAITFKLMPPEARPQPTDEQRRTMTKWIQDALDHVDCSGPRDPGHVPIRRLNRAEYNNTIRDLVGIDFSPADDFPADDTGYGFDNIADVLSVSPLLTEKYLAAAEQVMEKVFATEEEHRKRSSKLVRYPAAEMKNTAGQRARGKAWNLTVEGEVFQQHDFAAPGQYEIRVIASQEPAGRDNARLAIKLDGRVLRVFEVKGKRDEQSTFKLNTDIKTAGVHRLAAAYTNNYKAPNDPKQDRNLVIHSVEVESLATADSGPQSPVLRKIFVSYPSKAVTEETAARNILRRFSTRAYRRPAALDEVNGLLKLFKAARAEGDTFEASIKHALTAVLVSPHFLFRIEPDPARNVESVVRLLSDYELATRLSYFIWSSMPDDQLFAAAESGKLKNPQILEQQIKRMLADPKSRALVENFAGQWLELRNLSEITPDPERFAGFDRELKEAMITEVEVFFANLIKEDRSVLELLDADYTFANGRLAKHYGIKGIYGRGFEKISLAGTNRGGVLTMGAVLTVTAMPARTSPVKRGKFILEQILGTPPPPPPPDVPALPDKPQDSKASSLRERLEKHRADPNCAVCHMRMDPIGFSMENFDAVGAWREEDGGFKIDASGQMPDGTKMAGPADLKKMLLGRKREFVTCLSEKMLTYAVGRGMEQQDRCTIREIVQQVEQDNHRFSSLVIAIAKSDAFQKRRGKILKETPAAPTNP